MSDSCTQNNGKRTAENKEKFNILISQRQCTIALQCKHNYYCDTVYIQLPYCPVMDVQVGMIYTAKQYKVKSFQSVPMQFCGAQILHITHTHT